MLRGALEEVEESLSRVAQITSKPQEPSKPVREPQPPTNNRKFVVAPRTLNSSNGGSTVSQCPNGDGTVFGSQDVRIKQGTVKPNTTPAGDRLVAKEEPHRVQAGVVVT